MEEGQLNRTGCPVEAQEYANINFKINLSNFKMGEHQLLAEEFWQLKPIHIKVSLKFLKLRNNALGKGRNMWKRRSLWS